MPFVSVRVVEKGFMTNVEDGAHFCAIEKIIRPRLNGGVFHDLRVIVIQEAAMSRRKTDETKTTHMLQTRQPQTHLLRMDMLWPRVMSISTAARYLDTTPTHIEELCRLGSIAAYKENGQSWSIDRLDVDEYVERRKVAAQRDKLNSSITSTNRSGSSDSPYLTVKQAAEYLHSTPWTIAQAIRVGDLQAKRLGKRFVTTVQWLDDWFSRSGDAA